MVKINGENLEADGMILLDYLTANHYNPQTIAVERNEEIVPKAKYADTILAAGDVIEIVKFMGGG